MSDQPVIKGWKQQMMTVIKIGDEKPLQPVPWKQYKSPLSEALNGKKESDTGSDQRK